MFIYTVMITLPLPLAMMPLWLFTLGRVLMEDVRREIPGAANDVTIPFVLIVLTIALVAVPCILGLLLARFLPRAAQIIGKVVKPFAVTFLLFQIILGAVTRKYIFDYMDQWRIVVGCVLQPTTAMLIALSIALICKQGIKRARTIMIETAVQNTALAIAVVLTALPSPDADIALVAPLVSLFGYPIIFVTVAIVFAVRDCYRNHKKKKEGKDDDETGGGSKNDLFGSRENMDKDLQEDVADMKYLTNSTGALEDNIKDNNNVMLVKQVTNQENNM